MRHKEDTKDGFWRAALELHSYSKSLYQYAEHQKQSPNLMHDVTVKNTDLIMDIGGFWGEWTDKILTLGNPIIHIYEPHKGLSTDMQEKYKGVNNVTIFNVGLSNKNYKATLLFGGPGSTEFSESPGLTSRTTRVPMKDIATIMESHTHVKIMKINIEGGEYRVLDRLIAARQMSKIEYLYIQFHEWIEGSYKNRKRIRKSLSTTHTCQWSYPFVWEKWKINNTQINGK